MTAKSKQDVSCQAALISPRWQLPPAWSAETVKESTMWICLFISFSLCHWYSTEAVSAWHVSSRLVTGCSDKILLRTRNQILFPHRTYSCQGEGHTPNTPKRCRQLAQTVDPTCVSLHCMKRTFPPQIYRDFPSIHRVAWNFHCQNCILQPKSFI